MPHLAQCGGTQALDIGIAGHVAMYGQSTPAEGGDGGTRLFEPSIIDIGDDEIRPMPGHGECGAAADPAGATGNHRDFPCELHGVRPPFASPHALTRLLPASPRWPSIPAPRSPRGRCVGISPDPPLRPPMPEAAQRSAPA